MITGRRGRSPPFRDPHIPRRRILWRTITVYSALYRSKSGDEIRIRRSLTPPPKVRNFQGAGQGLRRYKLITFKKSTREVCIVARSTKTKKNPKSAEIEDDELDELAALEDLDDLEDEDDTDDEDEDVEEDEDEDDDDLDEDDEDEDEAPPPKKKGGTAKQKANLKKAQAAKKKKAAEREGVGSAEVAEHFGVDARTLRMVFRKHGIEKDEDSNQYRWPSFDHPEVKKIGKLLKGGAAKEVKAEGLAKLKAGKADKKNTKTTGTKKTKKKRAPIEDDDE